MLLIAVLAVLIAVNVVLLFLLFRPDLGLTAQPADQGPTCLGQSQRLDRSDALDPTSRAGSCRTAARRYVFQDGLAGDCWRLRHPRRD